MLSKTKYIQAILTAIVLVTVVLSSFQPLTASAQGQEGDGIVRDYNTETGKVTMISGENNEPITILNAMEARMSSRQRADALVQTFAPEFGVTNPASDLQIAEQDQPSENRVTTRYQQTYNGVPVIAGELIVNANDQGALSSMSGEVAQGLSLDTNPSITADQPLKLRSKAWSNGMGEQRPIMFIPKQCSRSLMKSCCDQVSARRNWFGKSKWFRWIKVNRFENLWW